jgi:hypothetical protein
MSRQLALSMLPVDVIIHREKFGDDSISEKQENELT